MSIDAFESGYTTQVRFCGPSPVDAPAHAVLLLEAEMPIRLAAHTLIHAQKRVSGRNTD